MFLTSMAFDGAGYTVENAASGDSDMLRSSMAFNGARHPIENALSGGSDQLPHSTAFCATEYLAGNEVGSGSDQFDLDFSAHRSMNNFSVHIFLQGRTFNR
ncbi:hypothetical protein ACOSP7_017259 [Xanthoceras sorbifolium]